MSAAAIAVLLPACDVRFVDPNPPVIARERLVLSPRDRAEPVVFGALLDLHIPDPALCAATRARALEVLRAVAAAAGEPVVELPARDLSPGCAQLPGRAVPVDLVDADVRAAEGAFPDRVVRPALAYLNNVDLVLPYTVASSLVELRARATARGLPPTLLWGVVLRSAATSFDFDATVPWSHATNDAMWASLSAQGAAALPLYTRTERIVSAPLTDPARARLVKICAAAGATVAGCPVLGRACAVTPGSPSATATFPPLVAAPRNLAGRPVASVSFEVCSDWCDRFVDRDAELDRWDELVGCVTGERT